MMKKITLLFLLLTVSFGYSQTSNYCSLEVLHLDIPAETASAINLTIENTGANTMKVTATSADIDVEFLDLIGAITDTPTKSAVDESVSGERSIILTWAGTPPAGDVTIQFIQWRKTSTGGATYQINDATTPFSGDCVPIPPLEDATLSDLTVDGATVDGFSANKLTYDIELDYGTTIVPTVVGTPTQGTSAAVTMPAGSVPGTSTVLVTANNDINFTETYTINFTVSGPPVALPFDFEGTTYGITTTDGAVISNGIGNDVLEIVGAIADWDRALVTFSSPIDLSDDANNTLRFTIQSTTAAPLEVHQHGISFQGGGGAIEMNFQTTGTEVENVELNFGASLGSRNEMHIFIDVGNFGVQSGTGGQSGTPTNGLSGTYVIDNISLGADPGPTCFDGIENGDETGVDCGGSCDPCAPTAPTDAPAAPTELAADVLSMYSESYTPIPNVNMDTNWGVDSDQSFPTIAGNEVLKMENFNFQGMEYDPLDASSMEYLHIDVWTPDASSFQITPISPGLEALYELSPTLGEWNSYDIDLTNFPCDFANLYQMKLDGTDGTTVFVDNIYFWKDAALGVSDYEIEGLTAYPNPSNNRWNISTRYEDITSIEVFNILGKNVLSLAPNKSKAKIEASNLKTGLYFAQIKTDNGINSIKLVKQ